MYKRVEKFSPAPESESLGFIKGVISEVTAPIMHCKHVSVCYNGSEEDEEEPEEQEVSENESNNNSE